MVSTRTRVGWFTLWFTLSFFPIPLKVQPGASALADGGYGPPQPHGSILTR